MNKEQLIAKLQTLQPGIVVSETKQYPVVTIAPELLHAFSKRLKEDADLAFDYLFCLTGTDQQDQLGVIYHMESTSLQHQLVVKSFTSNRDNAVLPTVCDIWKTAEFLEREVFDLLGITFTNHPDLRRIFLDEDWVGYPLRKDYSDDKTLSK